MLLTYPAEIKNAHCENKLLTVCTLCIIFESDGNKNNWGENKMKTTLIAKRAAEGAYGFTTDSMILDTDTHGRLLITDGWGGNDVIGLQYRWNQGFAVQLKVDDTYETLDKPWNDLYSTLEVVLQGQDNERPVLDWTGSAIAALAKRHA